MIAVPSASRDVSGQRWHHGRAWDGYRNAGPDVYWAADPAQPSCLPDVAPDGRGMAVRTPAAEASSARPDQ